MTGGLPRGTDVEIDPTGLAVVTAADVQGAIEELDAGVGAGGYTDPLTTLGDLVVHDGSVTTRLGVSGNDGWILTEDSGAPEGVAWAAPTGGGGSGPEWTIQSKTANYTATEGECVLCNSSGGAFTITLPTSPTTGTMVAVAKTSSDTNFVTISGPVSIGPYSQVRLKYGTDSIQLVYTGSKWEVLGQIGSSYTRLPGLSVIVSGTYGDTFDAASLDAKWTRVGFTSGDETYQTGDNGSEMQISGRAAGNYYYQSAPSGDFDLIWGGHITSSGALMFGPMIVDSSGYGVAAGFYNSSPNGPIVATVTGGAYDSAAFQSGTTPPTGSTAFDGLTKTWIRLRKSGTTYSVAASSDGENWNTASSTISRSFTVARIGFGPWYSSGMASCKADVFDVR